MFVNELFEAPRKPGRVKGWDYEEDDNQVVVTLKGKNSAQFTRLATSYKKVKNAEKHLKRRALELNKEFKTEAEPLFDAADIILTRVIETNAVTIKLTKSVEKSSEVFDVDGFIEDLLNLYPELEEQLTLLIDKFTEINTKTAPTKLRIDLKKFQDTPRESVNEGYHWIERIAVIARAHVESWAQKYDSQLRHLSLQLDNLKL